MKKLILIALISTLALQGCASALLVGGISAAASVHDRRSMGNQLDDKTLYFKLEKAVSQIIPETEKSRHNLNVSIYNGVVLLTGQSPSVEIIKKASTVVETHPNVKRVYNQIRDNQPIATSSHAHDVWLKSKIKAKLVITDELDALHIGVRVEDSEVFLMGIVNKVEAAKAVEVVRNINGVSRVVKAFEYIR